ncbi:NUDIX hydrolase [Calidifontibacter sp. DB0510]|uniref:NUDIX hydrolase n=1 Tax=Metallococcus carri TaxID=1656884 RepID=A0A967AX98_9MICO|nr:NUDIX hydrolase [Metallococcus carri]NHN54666.1 NUDIX hydrolase [Metallococcus carri]NOP37011.1 NUDIX hydrolase [Calidifontibacter sp. DB2511S]
MSPATDLEEFPRPGVTVDLALLTIVGTTDSAPSLRVLIQDRSDPTGRALPGAFIRERHTVADTVRDVLTRKVAISPDRLPTPRLLQLYDDPARDSRTWTISAAHSLSVTEAALTGAVGELAAVGDDGRLRGHEPLLFDHDDIVAAAVADLRSRYEFRYRYSEFDDARPDPDHFLPEPFTLHQLRKVHEAVVGAELHKDNFNRRMKPFLTPVTRRGEVVTAAGLRGRPAALYRRARR